MSYKKNTPLNVIAKLIKTIKKEYISSIYQQYRLEDVKKLIQQVNTRKAHHEMISIDYPDISGKTALHWATTLGLTDVVIELLKAKADPNIKNNDGDTPLSYAINQHYIDIARAMILDGRVNPHTFSSGDRTPVMLAIDTQNNEALQLLLPLKSNVNIQDRKGETALTKAINQKNILAVKLLLQHGALLDVPDSPSPLLLAIKTANREMVQLLFDAGADIKDVSAFNLFWASRIDLPIVHLLLTKGYVISDFEKAYIYFKQCDQRDPYVLESLPYLYEQLKRHPVPNPKLPDADLLLDNVKSYVTHIKDMHASCQKVFVTEAKQTMESLLPNVLNEMVYAYDVPLERLGFFQYHEPGAKKQMEAKEVVALPLPQRKKCSIM